MNKTNYRKPNTQHGFSAVVLLAVFFVITLIGFAAFRVIDSTTVNKDASRTESLDAGTHDKTTSNQELPEVLVSLTKEAYGISLPVTDTFSFVDENTIDDSIFSATVLRGDETIAQLYTVTGKGGYCEPAPSDTLHSVDALCPSYEEVARESGVEGATVITTKTTYPGSNGSTFQYCLRPASRAGFFEPYMGFAMNCGADDIFVVTETKFSDLTKLREDPVMQKLRTMLLNATYSGLQ